MPSTTEFLAALWDQLPLGVIRHRAGVAPWVNGYLLARHRQMHDPAGVAELQPWLLTGELPQPLLSLGDEVYQLEPLRMGEDAVLLLWPTSAIGKFAPHAQHVEQLYLDFREIFRNSFDGIFVADGEGRTLMVNPGCERNYGMTAEQLVGRHVSEFEASGQIRPVIATRVIEARQRVTAVQETAGGKTIMVTGIPLLDAEGKVRKVIINSRDTTEMMQLQEELARAQERLRKFEDEVSRLRMDKLAMPGIVLRSNAMQQIATLALRVAVVNTTVLITGESGVGKEVLARMIHAESARNSAPFVKINCGAIPRELLESELFGYEGGAFTGASKQGKVGIVEVANHGTLFLDEIGELPLDLQVKLLQLLQDKILVRLGGTRPIAVDVRIIAATNRDLHAMVEARQFRSDLFYRLNVVPIQIPPLRERKEDVLLMIQQFLDEINAQYGLAKRFSEQALAALLDYDWPGNVRELHNMIERLVVTSADPLIRSDSLPAQLLPAGGAVDGEDGGDLKSRVARFERELVAAAVRRCGSTRAAARYLNISQSSVVRRLAEG
jgi:PAS domain S-box-containing protein